MNDISTIITEYLDAYKNANPGKKIPEVIQNNEWFIIKVNDYESNRIHLKEFIEMRNRLKKQIEKQKIIQT
jgi:5S rRNA maturation endonuclease (ribonuclease M5)